LLCVLQDLERLHSLNIIHTCSALSLLTAYIPFTDVKPENILFNIGEDIDLTGKELADNPPKSKERWSWMEPNIQSCSHSH